MAGQIWQSLAFAGAVAVFPWALISKYDRRKPLQSLAWTLWCVSVVSVVFMLAGALRAGLGNCV